MPGWIVDVLGYIVGTGMVVSFICAAWAIPAAIAFLFWGWWTGRS